MTDPLSIPEQFPKRHQLRAAFLVRCWIEDGAWRFSLESIATRRRSSYLSLQALVEGVVVELSSVRLDKA